MDLRKATSRIVFALLAVIMAGSMMIGCSSEEFEGPKLTFATRSSIPTEDLNDVSMPMDTITPQFNYQISNIDGDSINLSFCVNWTEGAADGRRETDQSKITIVMHTISAKHVYHKAFLNKHIVLDEGDNTNDYRIRICEDYITNWKPAFDGIEMEIPYKIFSPLRHIFDYESNTYKLVGDTASGVIKTTYGDRSYFRSYFKFDADNEMNNRVW